MPKPFLDCVKRGGYVSTKRLSKGRYVRFCSIGGKTYKGEIKTRKDYKPKKKKR